MVSNSVTPSGGGGAGAKIVGLAVAAAPIVLNALKALNTPENREQLAEWATKADVAIRKLTLEGRVDARISVLTAQLRRPVDASMDQTQAWSTRLSQIEQKRELLRGPFDAKARRRHLKSISTQLDGLWAEIFEEI